MIYRDNTDADYIKEVPKKFRDFDIPDPFRGSILIIHERGTEERYNINHSVISFPHTELPPIISVGLDNSAPLRQHFLRISAYRNSQIILPFHHRRQRVGEVYQRYIRKLAKAKNINPEPHINLFNNPILEELTSAETFNQNLEVST